MGEIASGYNTKVLRYAEYRNLSQRKTELVDM